MAPGASPWAELSLVLKSGMALTVGGNAIGVLGTLGLTRVLSSLLFGVSPRDPLLLVVESSRRWLPPHVVCLRSAQPALIPLSRSGTNERFGDVQVQRERTKLASLSRWFSDLRSCGFCESVFTGSMAKDEMRRFCRTGL